MSLAYIYIYVRTYTCVCVCVCIYIYIYVGAINKNLFITPRLPPRGGHQSQTRTYKQAQPKRQPKNLSPQAVTS